MGLNAITPNALASAGVPFSDAHWFFTVAKPRQCKGLGDAMRVSEIIRKVRNTNMSVSRLSH